MIYITLPWLSGSHLSFTALSFIKCVRERKKVDNILSVITSVFVTLQYYDLLYMKCLYISNNSLKPWELVLPEPQHANSQPDLGCCN